MVFGYSLKTKKGIGSSYEIQNNSPNWLVCSYFYSLLFISPIFLVLMPILQHVKSLTYGILGIHIQRRAENDLKKNVEEPKKLAQNRCTKSK